MFDMSRYYGRVVLLRQLPTSCRHDAVAFGYRRVNVPPDGDLHPAVCTPSQAHRRGEISPAKIGKNSLVSLARCTHACLRTRTEQSSRVVRLALQWRPE